MIGCGQSLAKQAVHDAVYGRVKIPIDIKLGCTCFGWQDRLRSQAGIVG